MRGEPPLTRVGSWCCWGVTCRLADSSLPDLSGDDDDNGDDNDDDHDESAKKERGEWAAIDLVSISVIRVVSTSSRSAISWWGCWWDADDGADKSDKASDADDAEHGDYNGYADGRQTCRETLLPGERDGESGGSPGSRPCNRKLIRSLNIFTSQAFTIMAAYNLNWKIAKAGVLLGLSWHQLVPQKLCEVAHIFARSCL